ncbi:Transcription initiation factor IIA small chain (TFIIA 13.5 kDa subunit) [Pyricularia grisea]|nr:Transcription initiation factor IIA small chain (TFIIA 13.5 kDa subunit) [Pyricularia grisea]
MATKKEETFYELYRRTSLGICLTDALDDLITNDRINPQLAMRILANFDRVVAETLQEKVKARLQFKVSSSNICKSVMRRAGLNVHVNSSTLFSKLQGALDNYRFCDDVWTFVIKNINFKLDGGNQTIQADKVKIVSCNAKRPGTDA